MTEVKYKIKNGSFRVKIPTIKNIFNDSDKLQCTDPKNYNKSQGWADSNTHTVQMLSQNEYAHGWQQILPRKRTFLKYYKETEEGQEQVRISSNVFKMKINLAQLPCHLWTKRKLYNNIIRDGIYQYLIEQTTIDNEINELFHIITNTFNIIHKERVFELLDILKENDVYGWVVIRASNFYNYN